MTDVKPSAFILDPNDEFESVVMDLVVLNRKKRADYTRDGDILENFQRNVDVMRLPGFTVIEDILSMVTRKIGRITSLRGRKVSNESIRDSWEDLAVYSILGVVQVRREERDA